MQYFTAMPEGERSDQGHAATPCHHPSVTQPGLIPATALSTDSRVFMLKSSFQEHFPGAAELGTSRWAPWFWLSYDTDHKTHQNPTYIYGSEKLPDC